ncbi:hypothetical protein O9992_08530 [Vibrio lentus]|nr:hypothetical protein [Vibrio lentus]
MYQNEDWLLDREDEMLAKFHSESEALATNDLKLTKHQVMALRKSSSRTQSRP